MNTILLQETPFQEKLRHQWERWAQQRKHYPDTVIWWERFVKRKIRHLFLSEGTERRWEETTMENFYHVCLYDILQDTNPQKEKTATLDHLKAKLVRLYSTKLARGTIDAHNLDTLQGERVSLFHFLKRRTQRELRTITSVQDPVRGTHTSTKGIVNVISASIRRKYEPMQEEGECVTHMATAGHRQLPAFWRDALDKPITLDELQIGVNNGRGNKAPEICFEYFKAIWGAVKGDVLALFN
jgi:hypothetical protein